MSPHLESQLHQKYPTLFRDRFASSHRTTPFSGCNCPDAWYPILNHLFGYLTTLAGRKLRAAYTQDYQNQFKHLPDYFVSYQSYSFTPPQIILESVEESYDTLRILYQTEFDDIPEEVWANLDLKSFYGEMEKYTSKIDGAISFAEYQASHTPVEKTHAILAKPHRWNVL